MKLGDSIFIFGMLVTLTFMALPLGQALLVFGVWLVLGWGLNVLARD